MIVAEFEIYHSRPIAPTRRVALGARNLPVESAPGAGGLLLAGVIAQTADRIEPDLREDLVDVMQLLLSGRRVIQPRVRHRFQHDMIGLTRSTQRLVSDGESLEFDLETEHARPVQLALGAVYAAGSLPIESRSSIFDALVSGLTWQGPVDGSFISAIMGGRSASLAELSQWNDPVVWAYEILGLERGNGNKPSRRLIQKRFRNLLREAHPDHGGETREAAERIHDLTEARRILNSR